MRQINSTGLNLVKLHEGFRAKAYLCPASKITIGYGHVILAGESYLNSATLNTNEAEEILRSDLAIAERHVAKLIDVDLNDNQFAALVSFAFNLGGGNLKSSTLRRLLNAGDYKCVPEQLGRWVFASGKKLNGLIKRRKEEGELFEAFLGVCCCSCHESEKNNDFK